jgi:acyl-CoA thioesterase I
MFPISRITLTRLVRAAAATAFVGAFAAAHAQVPTPAPIVAPGVTPVAAPAGTPAAMPAVVATPARPALPEPAKPVAVPPAATPLAASPIACSAPVEFSRLDYPLQRTARRLAGGEPLTIVAIGSSSTAGAGASSPAASYPSRLAVELKQRFPGHDITVLNRGVNGEETPDMMARFDTGVLAEHPQLVLWQLGTNLVLRDQPLKPHSVELHEGIDELKASGTDLVLIDPQYAPKVLAKPETPGMLDQIALAAKEENIDLFRRFAVMHDWYEVQHLAFDVFVSPDGLHMNDWGYACWAKLLAKGIAEAATRPIASAAAHSAH